MANMVGPRSKRNDARRPQPIVISAAIAILAAVVLVCVGLVAVPLWTALVQGWQFQPLAEQCKVLKDARAREACDEKLRVEALQHPAKGANAPKASRSRTTE